MYLAITFTEMGIMSERSAQTSGQGTVLIRD